MRKVKQRPVFVLFLLIYSHVVRCQSNFGTNQTPSFQRRNRPVSSNVTKNELSSSDALHSESMTENCPIVRDIPKVSCLCDAPHTVRCHGELSSPDLLFKLVEHLENTRAQPFNVSLLDLSIQNISYLPSEIFGDLNLMGLIISSGGVKNIDPSSFSGLEAHLTALGLSSNELQRVPCEAIRILRDLKRLDLSENNISTLKNDDFLALQHLEHLNLSANEVRLIQNNTWLVLNKLTSLYIDRNNLTNHQILSRTSMSLRTLSLSYNKLNGSLNPNTLSNMPALEYLYISHNSLSNVTMGSLKNCKNLILLDLAHNSIDVVEDHSFRHLSKLQHLDMSYNNIISFSGYSLAHLSSLTYLNLADNALFAVTSDLFNQLPMLITLDLAANDISLIQPEVLNYTSSLTHLNLADNPLHCDCSIKYFWSFLKNRTGETNTNAMCATPQRVENSYLVELDTSDLKCVKDTSEYYHNDSAQERNRAFYDFKSTSAKVRLQTASWVNDDVQLVWQIDARAIPYSCQGVHVYEIEKTEDNDTRNILSEKLEMNCNSHDLTDPNQLVVTVPRSVIQIGKMYRYCLILVEHGNGDSESFLSGCSNPLLLNEPNEELLPEIQRTMISSLIAGNMGMSLVVQTRLSQLSDPCWYQLYVISRNLVETYTQLNCSDSRYIFKSLFPGHYTICASTEDVFKEQDNLVDIILQSSKTSQSLSQSTTVCTAVEINEVTQSNWKWEPLIILLFTLPGLALILTLYILGRRVRKAGPRTVSWRWDPRSIKGAKYFLYTGEACTPSTSLNPLPEPESSV